MNSSMADAYKSVGSRFMKTIDVSSSKFKQINSDKTSPKLHGRMDKVSNIMNTIKALD